MKVSLSSQPFLAQADVGHCFLVVSEWIRTVIVQTFSLLLGCLFPGLGQREHAFGVIFAFGDSQHFQVAGFFSSEYRIFKAKTLPSVFFPLDHNVPAHFLLSTFYNLLQVVLYNVQGFLFGGKNRQMYIQVIFPEPFSGILNYLYIVYLPDKSQVFETNLLFYSLTCVAQPLSDGNAVGLTIQPCHLAIVSKGGPPAVT